MVRKDVPLIDKLIGLNCWILDQPAIDGLIRKRYEDFIVEEILPDGTILSLDNPILKPSGLEGLFTHFILIKKGISNFEAIITIANKLNIPLSYFFYSGNKDKDAITVQRVAVWGVSPETLMRLDLPSNLEIRSPVRELRRIHIGDHKGNCFTILIRDISASDRDLLKEAINEIREKNLLNYFGYQRFGIVRPITHVVGKLLLMRRYRDAIITYLTAPSLIDDKELLEIKIEIREGNYKSALKKFPKKGLQYEKEIIKNIVRFKEDWVKVMKRIPSFLLKIFVEAYQGYIFNKLISKIICESDINLDKKTVNKLVPLIGYGMNVDENSKSHVYSALKDIIEAENISINFFKNKRFPPLSLKGGKRLMFLRPDFKAIKIIENKENKINLRLRFCLGKGQYATVVIREILKQNMIYSQLKQKYHSIDQSIIKKNLDSLLKFIRDMNTNLAI